MFIIVNKLEIKSSFTQWRKNDFVAVLYYVKTCYMYVFSLMIKELQEDVPKTVAMVNKMVNQTEAKKQMYSSIQLKHFKLRKTVFR